MFAKKKIILNSAINDNKKGIAEITRLDNLTHLSLKIANFIPNNKSEFIFLVKNNGIQQRFLVDNPKCFECEVNIPIDTNQKISCLLIENGQQPIFWGGTDTQRSTMRSIDIESSTQDNLSNSSINETPADDNISPNKKVQQSNINENNKENVHPVFSDDTSFVNYNIYNDEDFIQNNYNESINSYEEHEEQSSFYDSTFQNNLELNDINIESDKLINKNCIDNLPSNYGDELFEDSNLEQTIDESMQNFELIKNYEEHDFPHCAHCKYKELFFQQQHLQEAREELQKIAELQNRENNAKNENSTPISASNINKNLHNNEEDELIENIDNNIQKDRNIAEDIEEIKESINYENDDEIKLPYYYSLIQSQYEEMFDKYPAFDKLSQIIENSKWIMVDGIDDSYIMGIIYNGNQPQYLCYGVVQDYKQSPPIEIVDSSQWVPFDVDNEFGQGAYIMYQSAENGETIKVEVY